MDMVHVASVHIHVDRVRDAVGISLQRTALPERVASELRRIPLLCGVAPWRISNYPLLKLQLVNACPPEARELSSAACPLAAGTVRCASEPSWF